jgi:IclR family transcriptional regulator, acetate operon repressor
MTSAVDAEAGHSPIERTLEVLEYLSRRAEPISAGTIIRECGMPRSTVYRILRVMERKHFVVHFPEERLWGIGIAAFEIGSGYLRAGVLERSARPILARLTRHSAVTSHLAVLHGADVLYVLKQTTAEPSRPFVTAVGVRLPAHLTAVGRAILAALPAPQVLALIPEAHSLVTRTSVGPKRLSELREILRDDRARGYSMESNATTEDVSCLAAAVFDHDSVPIASIGVSYYSDSHPDTDIPALAAQVTDAAGELTRRLQGTVRSQPQR